MAIERSAHLNDDHSKSKNIRLFARGAFSEQDLWCRPPRGVTFFGLDTRSVFTVGN